MHKKRCLGLPGFRGEYTSKHLIILPEWPSGPNNSSRNVKKNLNGEREWEGGGMKTTKPSHSIELVLRWNLGSLHYHNNFVEEVYNRDKKEYLTLIQPGSPACEPWR